MDSNVLESFGDFLRVNRRLEESTIKETLQDVRRFLKMSNSVISYENIKEYLATYIEKAPKTYNSQITSLRRFIRDFLEKSELIMSFKMAPVDECQWFEDLPSKTQLKKGFKGLDDTRAKAIYLFTAATGLRKGEILGLLKSQINMKSRAVIAHHYTRKKRSGITFYNHEAAEWLKKYLSGRTDKSEKLFVISDRQWRKIWTNASKAANAKITSKVLRAWFSTELGELSVPDR
ncbi:MAG: tyrosine-type recombinase/integrase, partial [Candidatus Bathyarchaeota archaeon]